MSRRWPVQKDARGEEAERLVQALRGKDKAGDDNAPAIDQHKNAGLSRREEIALANENDRPFGLNIAADTIHSRVVGDDRLPTRSTYLKRH